MSFSFNLVSSRAVALGKIWKERLISDGGSDITEIGTDSVSRRTFQPWLQNASIEDRTQIGDIIVEAVKNGTPIKKVAKELKTIPIMKDLDAELIAYRETRFLYLSGTMQRYIDEHIQQGTWTAIDPQETRHMQMNGKTYDIDDLIWNELFIDGCKCWCAPVLHFH
jgi:SPP1 gp7 family putative phage head morphogenesis protein